MENMITKPKILLDTNILIYLSYTESKFKIKNLDSLFKDNAIFIADRSLLEFYRVYTSSLKQSVDDTINIIDFYQNSPACIVLQATNYSNQLTFKLAQDHQAKSGKIFDLNILAMAIENEINFLYTKNIKDFPETKQLEIIDPTL